MSRVIASDVAESSALARAQRVANLKAEASLLADFKHGNYKVFAVDTGPVTTDFASLFTLTRNSIANGKTYGGIAEVAVDTPRFDAGEGLRVEEERENLFLYSEDFTQADWSKTGATISADAIAAPDGSSTADELVEDTSTGAHRASQSVTVVSGTAYVASFFVKNNTRNFCQLSAGNAISATDTYANFDLVRGVVTVVGSGADSAEIEDVGSGFFRISLIFTADASASGGVILDLAEEANAGSAPSYTGDGSSSIYIWGAQFEQGSFITSYAPTGASTLTRNADDATRTLGDEYNPDEGALFVEAEYLGTNGETGGSYAFSDGTNNNRILVRMEPSSATGGTNDVITAYITKDGGTTFSIQSDVDGAGTGRHKIAVGYDASTLTLFIDGISRGSVAHNGIPTVTLLDGQGASLGDVATLTSEINIYPRALTADELEDLTT